jgi:predicted cupin superfamily sugar epimerase
VSGQTAADWIARLGLARHPEGGWYRQTYRAPEEIAAAALPGRFAAARAFSTAIYFLLEQGDVSHLHRLAADELWFFHAGGPLLVHAIDAAAELTTEILGSAPERGESLQAMVPAGRWFGAELAGGAPYALVSCTVAPGFDFADFELAERAALLALYPRHQALIERLTE